MRASRPTSAIVAFVTLSLAGCANKTNQTIALEPVKFTDWQQHLQSMKGKVVVVDVWATWCAPCIERFPHMVQLHNQYKDKGVEFVSMSVDDREDKAAVDKARQFVIQQKAAFPNYLMDENIMQSFEKLGVQGIPDVFLYDRTGKLRYDLNGNDPNHQATVQDVDDTLAKLVAET